MKALWIAALAAGILFATTAVPQTSDRAKIDLILKACRDNASNIHLRAALGCEGTEADPDAAAEDLSISEPGLCKAFDNWCGGSDASLRATAQTLATGLECPPAAMTVCRVRPVRQDCVHLSAPPDEDCRQKLQALVRATRDLGDAARLVTRQEEDFESPEKRAARAQAAQELRDLYRAYSAWSTFVDVMVKLTNDMKIETFGISSIPFCDTVFCATATVALGSPNMGPADADLWDIYNQAAERYLDALRDADPGDYERLQQALAQAQRSPPPPALETNDCRGGCIGPRR